MTKTRKNCFLEGTSEQIPTLGGQASGGGGRGLVKVTVGRKVTVFLRNKKVYQSNFNWWVCVSLVAVRRDHIVVLQMLGSYGQCFSAIAGGAAATGDDF